MFTDLPADTMLYPCVFVDYQDIVIDFVHVSSSYVRRDVPRPLDMLASTLFSKPNV